MGRPMIHDPSARFAGTSPRKCVGRKSRLVFHKMSAQ